MDLGIKGKVALVTGATRGIGRRIAECFADEGAGVAVCARNADEVSATVAALAAKGVSAWGQAADMTRPGDIDAFVAGAAAALGGIDMVVSNVSALSLEGDDAAWRAMFEIDMLGAVRLFSAALPHLQAAGARSGDAAFTAISSIVAGEPYKPSPYSAMKAALINYVKGAARLHAPQKVRCNVVAPGNVYFEGGVWERMKRERPDFYNDWIARNPTGRMATADEIATATVFLSSPRSAFTTGTTLVVDGCLTQHALF
ncbi:MAG: SDR family oxidoreductase [Pseudomonadota bacterium]